MLYDLPLALGQRQTPLVRFYLYITSLTTREEMKILEIRLLLVTCVSGHTQELTI